VSVIAVGTALASGPCTDPSCCSTHKDATDTSCDNPRPHGVKTLVGEHGLWHIRVGDYRVIYEIRDTESLVLIVRVAHRREVYCSG
jgi:mRNA-degrading endonuclease RelE of RelBE toxin-antitoxin system